MFDPAPSNSDKSDAKVESDLGFMGALMKGGILIWSLLISHHKQQCLPAQYKG